MGFTYRASYKLDALTEIQRILIPKVSSNFSYLRVLRVFSRGTGLILETNWLFEQGVISIAPILELSGFGLHEKLIFQHNTSLAPFS